MQKKLNGKKKKTITKRNLEVNETDYSILIDVSGNIIETEIEIKIDELPANAKAYISKTIQDKNQRNCRKITDNKGVVTYEAEIKGKDLILTATEILLKKKQKTTMTKTLLRATFLIKVLLSFNQRFFLSKHHRLHFREL